MILPCFQTIWSKPSLFYRDQILQTKALGYISTAKRRYMMFNQADTELKLLEGELLKQVKDFKYFVSWIGDSKKDMKVRIGLIWKTLIKLNKIWKSEMKREIKIWFFRFTVESVWLYGAESWMLTNAMSRSLDGTYTNMLRAGTYFTWRDWKTNNEPYGELRNAT